MSDLGNPDVEIIQKRLIVNIDDQQLAIKKFELRQLELQQEIKRFELEKEICAKQIKKLQDELALYNKT